LGLAGFFWIAKAIFLKHKDTKKIKMGEVQGTKELAGWSGSQGLQLLACKGAVSLLLVIPRNEGSVVAAKGKVD
jgi:hypothetical protein